MEEDFNFFDEVSGNDGYESSRKELEDFMESPVWSDLCVYMKRCFEEADALARNEIDVHIIFRAQGSCATLEKLFDMPSVIRDELLADKLVDEKGEGDA